MIVYHKHSVSTIYFIYFLIIIAKTSYFNEKYFIKILTLLFFSGIVFLANKIHVLEAIIMFKCISTDRAPKAIGPYSQAIQAGQFLYLSGVMPIDPATNQLVENDIEAQTTQIMENISALLEAAGYEFTDAVKTTCFLSDIQNFAKFNEIYARYFSAKPARSCVAVKDVPKGALVEVEVVAYK